MAKRNYKKKSMKVQPSVMTMSFIVELESSGKEVNYIDLSQCASLMNRRFYRQGINWAVSGFKILSQTGDTGQISIHKLPNTWVMSNSWEKSFRAWNKMNDEALAETPSVKPRFLDFKIYADQDHHQSGYGANLLPHSAATLGAGIQSATAGEWESSKISVPLTTPAGVFDPGTTVEREFIAVGSSYPGVSTATGLDAVSLIEGYAASRGLPNQLDPNTPADSDDAGGSTPENWLSAMFNDGTNQDSDVIETMISENNIAPYPFENDGVNTDTMYPGGANQMNSLEIHDQEFVTGTTVGGTTRLKGGNFPCGLIGISSFGFDATPQKSVSLVFQVSLVPGTHRGYLCEPMTEM
jgi:hypothetical protein